MIIYTSSPFPRRRARQHCAPVHNLFPFVHTPNTLHRDRIVVPAGWDNSGKLIILRDSFDAKEWGKALERDLSPDAGIDAYSDGGA
jgi:hypothetical protein